MRGARTVRCNAITLASPNDRGKVWLQ